MAIVQQQPEKGEPAAGDALFDEVFGTDEEEALARRNLQKKLAEKKAEEGKRAEKLKRGKKEEKEDGGEEDGEDEGEEDEQGREEEENEEGGKAGEQEEDDEAGEEEKEEDNGGDEAGETAEKEPKKKPPRKRKPRKPKKAAEGEEVDEGEAEKKRTLKEAVGEAVEVHKRDDEKRKALREKIKKIVVAKAEKAAEDEEKVPLDKELGVKEEGIKAGEPAREAAKKAPEAGPVKIGIKPALKFLEDNEGNVFIGRKQNVFQKYGNEAALFIGEVAEEDCGGKKLFLDSLNPHVVFVCGARGSGKSYIMGVIAEELALRNKNVGTIVIDPVGVFWSMRFPNREERELQLLAKWNLMPQGLENIKVFIPIGMKDKVPNNTFDATFSIPPALLTTDDWCLTFGIDRFSPSGLLLEKAIARVKQGYRTKEGDNGKGGKAVKPKKDFFSLGELIDCLRNDAELNSSDIGYKPDSIRALVSRFDAARSWGVFDEKGTPLGELSRETQLSIIDTSFLEDNVSALVIGILARRILAARKISTRQQSAQRYEKKSEDMDKLLEFGIPPTWLFIDEAHTLIPGGNITTPASNALIEYVKQGRQPGCSIVFATQQPSAINSKVLSQLDVMIAHKLVFDDDIKAVYKRTPAIIPKRYRNSNFIKTLPIGVALAGDRREETSRAFILRTRPRMSQHEGREAETTEGERHLSREKVLLLAIEMSYSKLDAIGSLPSSEIDQLVKTLNGRYKSEIKLSDVLKGLEKKGADIDPKKGIASMPGREEEGEEAEEPAGGPEEEVRKEGKELLPEGELELIAFTVNLSEEKARSMFNSIRKKKFLGLIGGEEALESIQLRYLPIYRIELNAFSTKQAFHRVEAYVNSVTGELLHFIPAKKQFVESSGLQLARGLSENEIKAVFSLLERKREFEAVVKEMGESEAAAKRALGGLIGKGIAKSETVKESEFFSLVKPIDLPKTAMDTLLPSLGALPVENVSAIGLMRETADRNALPKLMQKLWKNVIVKKIDVVYLPVYESFMKKKDGSIRRVFIEAVNGKTIELSGEPDQ